MIGNSGTNTAAYSIHPDLKYAPDDFVPVGLVAKTSAVLAIKNGHPAKTLAELVAYAKQNPGRVTIGHAGIGSSNFLICKTFIHAAAIDVTLVSYRGAAPSLNDLIGGQIDAVCDSAASVTGAIQSGQIRSVAVATNARLRTLPDVPTAREAGLPEFQYQGWNALFAPKGTPGLVIAKLNAALRTALANETLQNRLIELGSLAPNGDELSPDYVKNLVPAKIEKFRKLLAGTK